MVRGIGRAGSWWLGLAVVCAVGLLVVGAFAFIGRPHHGSDRAASHLAVGPSAATPSRTGTPAATPAGGVSPPSPVQAGLIGTPRPTLSARPAPSPKPSPRPSPSAVPPSSPPPYLRLDPASGAATLTPTWSASACPSGYQGSAVLFELNTDGTLASTISGTAYSVAAPFSGTLDGPVGELITLGSDVRAGGTSWVVGCFAGVGGTGAEQRAKSISVTLSADGSSYSSSAA